MLESGGEGLLEEVCKGGLNDRDQEAERSRLSDVRRLRSSDAQVVPGRISPGRMQVPVTPMYVKNQEE